MAEENDTGEKTEEPSEHRIEQFRKRGDVASSREITSVLVLFASLMTLGLSVVYIYEEFSQFMRWLAAIKPQTAFTDEMLQTIIGKSVWTAIKCAAPVLIVVFCISILSHIIQFGFLFSPEVLEMKLERINPLQGVKKLFSTKSIFEAFKGLFKFAIILSTSYIIMKDDLSILSGFLHTEITNSLVYARWFIIKGGASLLLGLAVISLVDFAWVKYKYKEKLKQTKQQTKEELKEREGNPEIKQKIRSIQREMATKRMMSEIPNADMIITNPTHISVAVKYDPQKMVAPIVVAKGADQLAMRIRQVAKLNDVPLVENIKLARTIYKTVPVGEAIPRNLYKALAEVLAFVYKLRKKKKALATA